MPLLLIFILGMTAGLRSLTPPAVVAWTAARWPALAQSPLSFMAAPLTAYVLAALALVELVSDKLPVTPSRLTPVPLTARIVMGGLCGATLAAASQQSLVAGAVVGAAGGLLGSYAGYHARHTLVTKFRIPDFAVALVEDVIAIGTALLIASRV
jgi:uncharacterized membrane protein